MLPQKIAPFQPVIALWEDAQTDASAQYDTVASCLRSYKPTLRKTIGLWIGLAEKDGRQCILLATDDDRSEDCPESIGGISYIPKGMVIKIEVMKPAPPAKRKR